MASEDNLLQNKSVHYLTVPVSHLDRKKSLSTSALPVQNNKFLCVPQLHKHREISSTLSNIPSYNSIEKASSQSSLTIPENYSFSSVRIRLYKRRWAMLVLCILYAAVSYMQWIQYSIVANVVRRYYDVSSEMVDWTSIIFMVVYVIFVFPVSYFMDCRNMRQTAVIAAVGTAIGSWIKVFSIKSDRFLIVILGQAVVAVSQVFVLSVPSRLAASWFSPEQVSSVCALSVFGNQLGIALGFYLTPLIIRNHTNLIDIGISMNIFVMSVAGVSTVIAIIVIATFKSSPELPPSHVQAIQRTMPTSKKGYWAAVGRLLKNKNYMILVVAYGLNVGVFNAFSTLLNQIVLNYFPDGEQDAGRIGFALVILGLAGSVVFGYLLDTMHKFKETAVWVCRLTSVTFIIFSFSLESGSKKLLSVASIFLGFFMTGFQPIGYEFAAELTFPEPDGPVSGILNISTHIFGIIITLGVSEIQDSYGDFIGNMCFAVLLIIDTQIISTIRSDLRRYNTHVEIANEAAKEIAQAESFNFEDLPLKFKIDYYS